jgi:lysophospholipase L1-like esterase
VVTVFLLLMAGMAYALLEFGTRVVVRPVMDVTIQLDRTLAYAARHGTTIEQLVRSWEKAPIDGEHVRLDPRLGWDAPPTIHRACQDTACRAPFRVLVLGDSVTFGFDVDSGDDFVSLLAGQPYGQQDVELRNAAVPGFGIYQMALKSARELNDYDPDLILFTYIENDILRDGTSYMFGKTRPTLMREGDSLGHVDASDLVEFVQSYRRAVENFYLSPWLLAYIWGERRWYLREWFEDHYRDLVGHVLERLRDQAAAAGARLAVVRLPQSHDFAGRDLASAAFEQATTAVPTAVPTAADAAVMADIEPCVRRELQQQGLDFDRLMATLHPPSSGHAAYAACIRRDVLLPMVRQQP